MSIVATPRAEALRARIDTVVFDMDGVLIDISRSIREVNCIAPAFYLREVLGWPVSDDLLSSDIIEMYKHAGGFNDDWDLTYAIVLACIVQARGCRTDEIAGALAITDHRALAERISALGGGIDSAEAVLWHSVPDAEQESAGMYNKPVIRQIFEELFAGEKCRQLYGHECRYYHGRGYIDQDRCLLNLAALPTGVKLGMQTGRTYEEAAAGIALCNLRDVLPDAVCVTKRDGFHKPDPGGLEALALRIGSREAGMYIGDTLDDLRTVQNLNRRGAVPEFLAALVLSGPAGASNECVFRESGADLIGEDVNEVLEWLSKSA